LIKTVLLASAGVALAVVTPTGAQEWWSQEWVDVANLQSRTLKGAK
jgi:hypothetical protein